MPLLILNSPWLMRGAQTSDGTSGGVSCSVVRYPFVLCLWLGLINALRTLCSARLLDTGVLRSCCVLTPEAAVPRRPMESLGMAYVRQHNHLAETPELCCTVLAL